MSQRQSTYTDTLVDGSGNALVGAVVTATLLVPSNANAIDGLGNVVAKKVMTATTNSSGVWTLTLDYPGDLATTGCTWQFNEAGTVTVAPLGYSYSGSYTVSDWYGAAPASGTIEMQVTLEDPSETAVSGRTARVYLSQNGVDTSNGVVYSTSIPVKATTDGSGVATFYLSPTAHINPPGTQYRLVIDNEPTVFIFTVPTSGGPYNITDYLTVAATSQTVQITTGNILHDSSLSAPVSGAPYSSPTTLTQDMANLEYATQHTVPADATTTSVGGVEIDRAPVSGHPVAVTTTSKGATGGVAPLDSAGHVPLTNLSTFGPSGAGHAAGIVPDPGGATGTTHYLREDGTWTVPPVNTGPTGPTGATGTAGATGATGPAGATGATGPSGTGGGSYTALAYSVLTDGNSNIIFAGGDVVMVASS